jgi:recombinational DNA repair protein RecR
VFPNGIFFLFKFDFARKNNMYYPKSLTKLIESYMKLPGIGQKTATRLAHELVVGSNIDYADEITLLKAIEGCKEL